MKILHILFLMEMQVFALCVERLPNPTVTHVSPFAKYKAVAGRNASVLYQSLYEPLLNNPRWMFAPFMKEALNNENLTVSQNCKTQILRVIEDFPATHTIQCKYQTVLFH